MKRLGRRVGGLNKKIKVMENIIEKALNDLDRFFKETGWYGRENEVVNLFAHHFLTKHIELEKDYSISQIGIEVAVKQLPSLKGKKLVRKDLVIWKKPNQTVWNKEREPVHEPEVILEWKVNSISKTEVDVEWLKEYTKVYPNVLGYSICAFVKDQRGLSYKKITKGEVEKVVK